MKSTFFRPSIKTIVFLLVLVSILSSIPASAQQSSHKWAQWELNVDFTSGQVEAIWIVRAGAPELKDAVETYISLQCQQHGNVTFTEGYALFNSATQDYISCEIPDFAQVVEQLTSGLVSISSNYQGHSPWVSAQILLSPQTSSDPEYGNPLLYHPNMQFSAPLTSPSSDYAYLRFNPMQSGMEMSGQFKANEWSTVWSGDDTETFWEYADLNGWAQFLLAYDLTTLQGGALHWRNGQILNGPLTPQGSFPFSSEAATIYIGYNPDTNTYLDGALKRIGGDPPAYDPDD